jgi:hypothetical protein
MLRSKIVAAIVFAALANFVGDSYVEAQEILRSA